MLPIDKVAEAYDNIPVEIVFRYLEFSVKIEDTILNSYNI